MALADQPQPARPKVGGSSLFDTAQQEAEATISQHTEPVEKEVSVFLFYFENASFFASFFMAY